MNTPYPRWLLVVAATCLAVGCSSGDGVLSSGGTAGADSAVDGQLDIGDMASSDGLAEPDTEADGADGGDTAEDAPFVEDLAEDRRPDDVAADSGDPDADTADTPTDSADQTATDTTTDPGPDGDMDADSGPWPSTPYLVELEIQGEDRRALVHPGDGSVRPAPLVMFFHGRGGDVDDSARRRGFHDLWPEAIIVYAEGTYVSTTGANVAAEDVSNKYGWTLRWPYRFALGQDKDIEYVEAVLAAIEETYDVDPGRVFASGHSSGGFFTLSLMELMQDRFAAFALVGAYARYKVADPSSLSNSTSTPVDLDPEADRAAIPRPVLYMFGNQDTTFDGDSGTQGWPGWSAAPAPESLSRSSLRQLFIRNGCVEPATAYWANLDRQVIEPVGAPGAEVHWQLYDEDHSWPPVANAWAIDFFKDQPTAAIPAFLETFNATAVASPWIVVDQGIAVPNSAWAIVDGAAVETGNSHDEAAGPEVIEKRGTFLWADTVTFEQGTLSARVYAGDNDGIGLMYGIQNSQTYYRASLDADRSFARLVRADAGSFTVLDEDLTYESAPQDTWFTLRIEREDDAHAVFVDDTLVLEATDDTLGTGSIGLYAYGMSDARFDSVLVWDRTD